MSRHQICFHHPGLNERYSVNVRWRWLPADFMCTALNHPARTINVWLKRYREQGEVIYWGDETRISNQDQTDRSWAPKGVTPAVRRSAKRISQSMISAVSNRGLMRLMLYDGALNVDRFTTVLRRLIKDARHKVSLVVDKLKVHHAHKVKARLQSHRHEIELLFLPAYAARLQTGRIS